jgi:hypothetical protein
MIHEPQHTLTHVTPQADGRLSLKFADGYAATVSLHEWAARRPALQRLIDPMLFAKATRDARGGYVVWIEDELEIAADNLRHLAVEQAGGIGHERMHDWMARNALTQVRAAEAIGISRRMLNYYLSGAKPIPKTVWLACLGFEVQDGLVRSQRAA